jgi:hypothetical protein
VAAVRLLNRAEYYTFVAKTPQLLAVEGFLHQTWENFFCKPGQLAVCVLTAQYSFEVEVRQFIDCPLSSTFTLKKWTQPPEMPMDKAYPQGN